MIITSDGAAAHGGKQQARQLVKAFAGLDLRDDAEIFAAQDLPNRGVGATDAREPALQQSG